MCAESWSFFGKEMRGLHILHINAYFEIDKLNPLTKCLSFGQISGGWPVTVSTDHWRGKLKCTYLHLMRWLDVRDHPYLHLYKASTFEKEAINCSKHSMQVRKVCFYWDTSIRGACIFHDLGTSNYPGIFQIPGMKIFFFFRLKFSYFSPKGEHWQH